MHSAGIDLLEVWVAALALMFALLFAGALSMEEDQPKVGCSIGLTFLGAVAVTIGLLVGFIGVW